MCVQCGIWEPRFNDTTGQLNMTHVRTMRRGLVWKTIVLFTGLTVPVDLSAWRSSSRKIRTSSGWGVGCRGNDRRRTSRCRLGMSVTCTGIRLLLLPRLRRRTEYPAGRSAAAPHAPGKRARPRGGRAGGRTVRWGDRVRTRPNHLHE